MTDLDWIVVCNWDGPEGFQHYKDRDPVWVKNYTRLLSKPEYLTLTPADRGILHGLWLLYARSSCAIPALPRYLAHALNAQVTRSTLERLNHAGFIEFSASKPLAERSQAASPRARREEEETERETETQDLEGSTVSERVFGDTPLEQAAHRNGDDGENLITPEEINTLYQPKEIEY